MNTDKLGATLTFGGVMFRTWAPAATQVMLRGSFSDWADVPLERDGEGFWSKFVPGAKEGDQYKFYVVGTGSAGYKRDSHARAIYRHGSRNCAVTNPASFPWHDANWKTPPYEHFIIYQLHVGAFFAEDEHGVDQRPNRVATFIDVIRKIPYLADLGVTAVQLLPIQEFRTERGLGYNGTNYFSPEVDYSFDSKSTEFERGFQFINQLLTSRGLAPYAPGDLNCQTKQLMALIDLLHVHGIAIIFDVVYNHAGGDFGDEGIYFYDRQPYGNQNNSLYFTDREWAGGLGFAYWKEHVRQFLIDNAKFFIDEYHVDGFRFDEVTVIDQFGGWSFLRDLTNTIRYHKPDVLQIAEYWADQSVIVRETRHGGAGFDSVVDSGLRGAVRNALKQASLGNHAAVDLHLVVDQLYPKHGPAWRQVPHLENHDIVRVNNTTDRDPRIAELAGGNDPRSWYARSRSRWAAGVLLTAPGIPMLFMGQEILEDKYWSDNPGYYRDYLIDWDGLEHERPMQDYLRCVRELCWLRRRHPALRKDGFAVHHRPDSNRVFAFHRWVEGVGRNAVVVANLNESSFHGYQIGFPLSGHWFESFNSDVFDNWVNPNTVGNGGHIDANAGPFDGLQASARLSIPANSVLVFTRDQGDAI
ncbi:alpha-amylase family glycosyl hydrolase [Rhodopirellula sp. MGV]|uniref:alpha-amylase family glycosyl hydrolase n=1 Tax=Rhodopirellula sp. MGV TaxID=2023130 RepID=UPI000B97A433|nr:alpha-amylase family glycosyl hydrolase [Rhodopirellula sp. MGV]OYP38035.1 1,4-alpha-glucan branching protein [Rhodopirellula sp. MGV]PNY36148.1 1,4-alpha-glucan branching protein [Rhodopirellula baltica]